MIAFFSRVREVGFIAGIVMAIVVVICSLLGMQSMDGPIVVGLLLGIVLGVFVSQP